MEISMFGPFPFELPFSFSIMRWRHMEEK